VQIKLSIDSAHFNQAKSIPANNFFGTNASVSCQTYFGKLWCELLKHPSSRISRASGAVRTVFQW
jgi:hypothetical protein